MKLDLSIHQSTGALSAYARYLVSNGDLATTLTELTENLTSKDPAAFMQRQNCAILLAQLPVMEETLFLLLSVCNTTGLQGQEVAKNVVRTLAQKNDLSTDGCRKLFEFVSQEALAYQDLGKLLPLTPATKPIIMENFFSRHCHLRTICQAIANRHPELGAALQEGILNRLASQNWIERYHGCETVRILTRVPYRVHNRLTSLALANEQLLRREATLSAISFGERRAVNIWRQRLKSTRTLTTRYALMALAHMQDRCLARTTLNEVIQYLDDPRPSVKGEASVTIARLAAMAAR